jgi:exopolyphosphatase/guanosine-5'-triphosphate,3'-diphosphate pyrophosphatase
LRYEAESDAAFLRPARLLLDAETANRAEVMGIALRLAYTLSAGTKDLLAGTRLLIEGPRLVLRLRANSGVFGGESVLRRLERLAQSIGLQAAMENELAEVAE